MKRHKQEATAKSQVVQGVTATSNVQTGTSHSSQKTSNNKRKRMGMNVEEMFDLVRNVTTSEPVPPLVLSPRSLFKMLCSVHGDVYPNMLPDKIISNVTESLPATT